LLRILLIGYLYGISSERKLFEELRMHLAWRWFTGLGFDQEVPHHSTFSKNRHGRFQESKLFKQLFERIVAQCLQVGLVRGDKLSVDGTFVEANACKESRISREQLTEAVQVNRTVCEYLAELEMQNPSLVHIGVQIRTTTTEKGRSALRGTEEPHRPSTAPSAQVEVRARAVLPRNHRLEHQATGPAPQPANDTTDTCHSIGPTKEGTA
jgi:hypothetical protein